MFCTQCGAPLADGSRFCALCGSAVTASPTVAPAASAPVQAAACGYIPVACIQPLCPAAAMPQAAPYAAPAAAAPAKKADAPVNWHMADPAQSSVCTQTPAYRQSVDGPAAKSAASATLKDSPDPDAPVERVPQPTLEDTHAPLSVWQTLVCYLSLFCLPVGNIIFACVWGFRQNEHPQRRTLARAALPLIAVGLLLAFGLLLWATLHLQGFALRLR